jgi:hypothetical protein
MTRTRNTPLTEIIKGHKIALEICGHLRLEALNLNKNYWLFHQLSIYIYY